MHCSLLDNGLFFYPDEDNTSLNKPCCHFSSGKLSRLNIQDTNKFYNDPFRKLNIKLLDEIMANVAKKKKTIYSKKQKKDEKILKIGLEQSRKNKKERLEKVKKNDTK